MTEIGTTAEDNSALPSSAAPGLLSSGTTLDATQHGSRRARRDAESLIPVPTAPIVPIKVRMANAGSSMSANAASARKKFRRGLAKGAVLLGAAAIIAPIAIPAYAFDPNNDGASTSLIAGTTAKADAQSLDQAQEATTVAGARDGYTTTSAAELRRTALQASYRAYSGPTAADYVKNPPFASYDTGTMLGVAQSYIGTPYVFGGATPAGFDCSGFVMFVLSQFGISLPHSVHGQAALGIKISPADALPGDLIIMPGHDGFYMGNGLMLHAPYPGASVRIQPIWTSDYYFVRIVG